MNTDRRNQALACIGIAESIAIAVKFEMERGRLTIGEFADVARTLRDIEDRLYKRGEYAPENVADLRGGAR